VRIQRVQCIAIAFTECLTYRQCVYRVFSVSPVRIQRVKCIAVAFAECLTYSQCVYRVFNVSPVRIQRVQCIAIAFTECLTYRQCVYRVFSVSPVCIQGVQFIVSAHTDCSIYHQFAYSVQCIASAYTGCSIYRPALLRVLLYFFLNISASWDGWLTSRSGRFPPRNDPVPTVQEAQWYPEPVCTCTENFSSFGIRPPDRPTLSESLYLLSYPGTSSLIYLLLFHTSFFHFTCTPIPFYTLFSHCPFICAFILSFLILLQWLVTSVFFSPSPFPSFFNLLSQTPSIYQLTSFSLCLPVHLPNALFLFFIPFIYLSKKIS
jgi:hypothetical protein